MDKHQNHKLVQDGFVEKNDDTNIEEGGSHVAISSSNQQLIERYQSDIVLLESQLEKLNINYQGMLAREQKYLKNIADLKDNLIDTSSSSLSRQDILKLQANYEGILAREERYLKEIQQLKYQVQDQKASLHRTYSYRLGYLLIHATKSFKNFINLPTDLIRLYRDNKQRKNLKLKASDRLEQQTKSNLHTKNKKRSEINVSRKPILESYLEQERDVKIATIMDEFTSLCFAPEAETLQITPESYQEELAEFKPDFLFIESAWQGKDGLWKLKVSQQADELYELIAYCQKNKIKTLFWNKEDPVHFGTFIEVAKLVDVVFTTDIDCIQKYKEIVQHDAVYLMPFAAQPKVHNPIELYERINKFNFAGSYYLKYPVRQRDFAVLSDVAINSRGLDIYDRNFNNDHPHYQFPKRYQPLILGSLAPEEIDKAYKGYEFGINMNTIKQSQTMFARRVFEMLASNTIVLSNYSRGVRLLFGDLVVCSDNKGELQRQVDNIIVDEITRKKFKLQGLRSVLSQHTYEHRLNYILQKLKIHKDKGLIDQHVAVLAKCETQADIDWVISQFKHQSVKYKTLLIETSISVDSSEGMDIKSFKDSQELLVALTSLNATHVTVLNCNDGYGKHYLMDMLLSYHYLKYHNDCPVTKDRYYSYTQNKLLENQGKEYLFVNEYQAFKTLYTKKYFMDLLDKYQMSQFLAGFSISENAFSIDTLNYISNGRCADGESLELVCQDLVLDPGVSLSEHLLPIAENITFNHFSEPATKKVLSVDKNAVEETLRKEIKFSEENGEILLDSQLPANQHRLIALTRPVEIEKWNRINLKNTIQFEGDVLLVVQFLDKDYQQLTHSTVIPTSSLTFDIPEGTIFGKVSVRLKGASSIKCQQDIQVQLENIMGSVDIQTYDSDDIVFFSKDDIDRELVRPKSKQIQINNTTNGLEIKSTLADDKHAYLYFGTIFTREEVNLVLNSVFETVGNIVGVDFRTVFLFLDNNKEKIAHSIIKVDNHSHAMAIPEECGYIRIGFKITGSGSASLQTLKIGEIRERVNNLIGKSDTLVLAKQYPAYDDLYKYGFLHSRLRAYKKSDELVDMFKISALGEFGFSEFESIDIFTGDLQNLRDTLKSGQFQRVFVHILDRNMWSILEEFVDQLEIVIWVHGSEAQVWQRRAYELEGMQDNEIIRRKKLSDQRKAFWQSLISKNHANVRLVFVSEYFKNEFVSDICNGEENFNYEVIHNYIDNELFPYHEKTIEDAYKVLSIRPFSSLTYANDLTVKAILELSKDSIFEQFQFTIVGNGPLFDETVAPIKHFNNVILRKEFLSQELIAELHRENGVFLVPTRMDTQGVSRGEATSSGLVAVTTDVAAVSEFVHNEVDGISVTAENFEELAKALKRLAVDPALFKALSSNGANRVKKQCSFDKTIIKEISLKRGL